MTSASRVKVLPFRERGVRLALSLANEQEEQAELQCALRLVRQHEEKIQKRLNAAAVSAALGRKRGPKQRRRREPEEHQTDKLEEMKAQKRDRNLVRDVQNIVVHKFQKALKLHHLRKRARATWSVRCTEDEFMGLFGGCSKMFKHSRSGKLCTLFSGKDTASVNALLGPVLSMTADGRASLALSKIPWRESQERTRLRSHRRR